MIYAVFSGPDVGNDGIGSIFSPRPFDVVGVEQGYATWGIVRRVVQVPSCNRVFQIKTGLENGRKNKSMTRLIAVMRDLESGKVTYSLVGLYFRSSVRTPWYLKTGHPAGAGRTSAFAREDTIPIASNSTLATNIIV